MDPTQLKQWRREQRNRLLAARSSLEPPVLERWRHRIDSHLAQTFPREPPQTLALCWPIQNEYDARHYARGLREHGWRTVLPVVVARGQALVFREWHPGVEMAMGALDIPYPRDTAVMVPDVVLLPLVGWDAAGYRLGYGAGYFDRTLASLGPRPFVIGVGYEMGRLATIHPQAWDIALDCIVTEEAVHRPSRKH